MSIIIDIASITRASDGHSLTWSAKGIDDDIINESFSD